MRLKAHIKQEIRENFYLKKTFYSVNLGVNGLFPFVCFVLR